MGDAWSPEQYERFREERRQPFFDLLASVRALAGMKAVDLGCGTGELTAEMHRRLEAGETLGIDRSEAMLAKSAAFAAPGLRFEAGDIAAFGGRGYDLILSNAALHWVPDHPALFARLAGALAPGGQLAVQMPANFDQPSHTVAVAVAAEPPFAEALRPGPTPEILSPERYATLLDEVGLADPRVTVRVYGHRLAGPEEVIEWVKGTLLTCYQSRMPADLFPLFVARYGERLLAVLPGKRPFFFPFKRIFLHAERNS